MKRIVIIDHFSKTPDEPGNNRFVYLADMLCSFGYSVEIITTTFSHLKKEQRNSLSTSSETLQYRYTMLPEPGYDKNVCLKRLISHRKFGKNLSTYLRNMEKPDLVFISVPSLDVGTVAGNYCSKNNIPFIVDIQDVWPEAFKLILNIPVISDIIFSPMTLQANRFYSQADKIIAVSEMYKSRGLQANKKDNTGLCVYLGTDLSKFDEDSNSIAVEKPENELWISYVGTLGHSYNIEIIIDALNLASEYFNRTVVFNVFGDGPYLNRFKKYSMGCKVKTVFHGRLDYSIMAAYLCRSDIAVNPISKGAAQSIINKHADYAAAGLPIINTQECEEYRHLLEKYNCGINCGVESVSEVAEALIALVNNEELRSTMGNNSRKMAEELFDRRATYLQICEVIEQLLRRNSIL